MYDMLETAFSALTLLVEQQEGHSACKKLEWWGTGMVICLQQDADLHMAQLMLLPLTVSCFSKIQIGFTFLVPAHLGSPGKRAVKRVCVCVYDMLERPVLHHKILQFVDFQDGEHLSCWPATGITAHSLQPSPRLHKHCASAGQRRRANLAYEQI